MDLKLDGKQEWMPPITTKPGRVPWSRGSKALAVLGKWYK